MPSPPHRRPLDLNEADPFPRCVEFQTVSACNARCGVCPYEQVSSSHAHGKMTWPLIERIIGECGAHAEIVERIIPYLNNEPFADRRILEVLRLIRHTLDCHVELSTNLSLLRAEDAAAVASERLIDTLRISMFGASAATYETRMRPLSWVRFRENLRMLAAAFASSHKAPILELIMVGTSELGAAEVAQGRKIATEHGAQLRIFGYLDRAGNGHAQNTLPLAIRSAPLIGCDLNRPFERLALRWNGDAVLCSQDWASDVVLGNITNSSMDAVWRGQRAREVREFVSGRRDAPRDFLCRSCKLAMVE